MFLLIPILDYFGVPVNPSFTFQYVSINTLLRGHFGVISPDFTFQYVSINTQDRRWMVRSQYTLHSNMFLLILTCSVSVQFVQQSLHSNMFLLIRIIKQILSEPDLPLHSNMFLLIQSDAALKKRSVRPLHSNMFLLIHYVLEHYESPDGLYIPICFY